MRRGVLVGLVGLMACSGSTSGPLDDASATSSAPSIAVDTTTALQADSEADASSPVEVPPTEPGSECASIADAKLVRSRSIAGGRQVHLNVTTHDGAPASLDEMATCFGVAGDRAGSFDVAVHSAERGAGATLIVARWTPEAVDRSRQEIDELLLALPGDERIAVWAWSDDLVQIVGATDDRGRITQRLDAVWSVDTADPLGVGTAADLAAEEWEDFGEGVLLGNRSIVFVAPDIDLDERPDIDRDIITDHWIVRSGDGGDLGAEAVSAAIRLAGSGPLTSVEFCDDGGDLDLTFTNGSEQLRSVGIGEAAVEHIGAPCDVSISTADGQGPVSVSFDAVERRTYDAAVAIADELTGLDRFNGDVDPEWVGSLSFDGGATMAPFEASFRGQSSIECVRRNWSIDLEGGEARYPISGTGADEFVLASLCGDAGYVNTLTGSTVLSQFGLWSQATGTVSFEIDAEPQGVYLVIEDPETDLRQETSRIRTVLRRRYDVVGVEPDVLYVDSDVFGDDQAARSDYDDLLFAASSSAGDELIASLRERFDLDQYLRWTASMSILGSGDHIDELYFVGAESINAAHEPITWFTINGWDPDDLFAECHRDGRFALDDPNGLLSCTESLLDVELFADPVVYDLFADHLAALLEALPVARFEEVANGAADQVTRHLVDAEVAAAMIEIDPAGPTSEAAISAVRSAASGLVDAYTGRHAALEAALAAYRSRQ